MYVLSVTPLASGLPYEELSYFSKEELSSGDLIAVTIRKRVYRAIVISCVLLSEEKQSVKRADFAIKKIHRILKRGYIEAPLWKALEEAASYQLLSVGKCVYDLLPEKVFELNDISFALPSSAKGFENLLLQHPYTDRITRYKSSIREMFAKKHSLVIFFPTITDIEHMQTFLTFGIEDYVVSFHSGLSEKQSLAAIAKIQHEEHPILILTTPSLLPWSRKDIGLLVMEREHSPYYYTHGDTGYDMRKTILFLAESSKLPLVRGSHMLSLDAHLLLKMREAHEIIPLHSRNDAPIEVISMHDENASASPYLSKKTLSLLHEIKSNKKGHYFLYAHRKGMYPTTVCSDCGTMFSCPNCERPYVLHKIAGVRTYVCHGCEHIVRITEDTTLSCRHCSGWRMQTLGIATTGVEDELMRLGLPVFVIDSERTNTKPKAKKIYKQWKESEYGVLVGTEMASNFLEGCDGITILSLDSLFALPEYRTDEKIVTLVTEMAEKVHDGPDHKGRLILQTRLKKMPIIKHIRASSYVQVYQEMLKEREAFLLPPHYTIIKASFENLPDDMKLVVEQALSLYILEWYEAGKGITLLFIHIKESLWKHDEQVRNKIKRVLMGIHPQVNPLHFFI